MQASILRVTKLLQLKFCGYGTEKTHFFPLWFVGKVSHHFFCLRRMGELTVWRKITYFLLYRRLIFFIYIYFYVCYDTDFSLRQHFHSMVCVLYSMVSRQTSWGQTFRPTNIWCFRLICTNYGKKTMTSQIWVSIVVFNNLQEWHKRLSVCWRGKYLIHRVGNFAGSFSGL